MDAATVDAVRLNFNPQSLFMINAVIGLMMLGVSLDLKVEDFKRILVSPKGPAIGLFAQFILLPVFTYFLTLLIKPSPSMALGMILIAACPGGNLSNIMTYLAKGNVALSISMTAVSTAAAVVMTPLNLSLWGNLNPATAPILKQVSLSPIDVFFTIFIILGIPLILGMTLARLYPRLVEKVRRPFRICALLVFMAVVFLALVANWRNFLDYVGLVVIAVFLHNAMALAIGYWTGRAFRLNEKDSRAVSIEVGIQNSALGLILVFNFFGGLGGMAIVAAWWGIWHIISGLCMAGYWSRKPLPKVDAMEAEGLAKG